MEDSKKLFSTLESILKVATDINTLTQNQETIILHGAESEMMTQLASNKQDLILKLDELETQFQSIYAQNKELIRDKVDVERLQGLVAKVVETKTDIAQSEDKNRRLWANKDAPKIKVKPVQQPNSYVVDQYKKHSKKES